ncbi:hypothetical protein ACQP1P_33450 [Dactylosporangium sp. CA-052675]|uniref:hypothetical protein n=1 Tax=Dactylosporangium sp. CA-052675 TaxID=3239927 RepID=UPI003D91AF47
MRLPGTIVVAVAAPSPEANVGGTEPGQNISGAVLDSIVLLALERSLGAYCTEARNHRDAGTLLIRAVVVTMRPPAEPGLLQKLAGRIVREHLPGARVRVHIDRQDNVAAPGYRITLHPPLPGPGTGPTGTATMPESSGPDTVPYRPEPAPVVTTAAALTLVYGDWRWRYLLPETDQWLPFGRGLGVTTGAIVRIPDFVAVVPRGRLLLIRHHAGVTRLHRCNERRDYLVRVDGRALPPGHSLPVGASGRITYGQAAVRTGTGQSEVGYKLSPTEVR